MKDKNRILCATCTCNKHEDHIKDYLEAIESQTVPLDLFFIETSTDNDYAFGLSELGIRHMWYPWMEKDNILNHLARARELIRWYLLANNYDYLFVVDTDIMIKEDLTEILLAHDVDNVSPIVPIYLNDWDGEIIQRFPCVLKNGEINLEGYKTLNFYKNSELRNQGVKEVYGNSFGCSLIKASTLRNVPFRYHPSFVYGEDLWFHAEYNDKGYKEWVDTSVTVEHRSKEWDNLGKFGGKIFLAIGDADATEANMIDR